MAKYLVTGGCGFIGSHLVDRLVALGHRVRVLDCLDPQVHDRGRPDYLNEGAEYLFAGVGDVDALTRCMEATDVVFHFAACVGVGQSMYEIERYTRSNTLDTARLMDLIANGRVHRPRKLIVASSMSVYGEGAYDCGRCGAATPAPRRAEDMTAGRWEPVCASCGSALEAIPTAESKPVDPTSVYALGKYDQERLCVEVGRAYDLPVTALRFFNVYGPRQALSNPYTGVAAIFSSRIKAGRPPVVFEDGRQRRDFVSVHDIVTANLLVMDEPRADFGVFNVGSGESIAIADLAVLLLDLYGRSGTLEPEISGQFRKGDIRHCFADVSRLRELGFSPSIELREGLQELAAWAAETEAEDRFDAARRELEGRGLA
jgi:dTDP-L-rhamnose 4-epimerase